MQVDETQQVRSGFKGQAPREGLDRGGPVPRPRWQRPACRTGSGEAVPGSGARRGPREGCGVFGVHPDAVSPCRARPVGPGERVGTLPVAPFGASGHGPLLPRSPRQAARRRLAMPIGLPALYATVGRHNRARVAFCLPCRPVSAAPARERYDGLRHPGGPRSNRRCLPGVLASYAPSDGLIPAVVALSSDALPP